MANLLPRRMGRQCFLAQSRVTGRSSPHPELTSLTSVCFLDTAPTRSTFSQGECPRCSDGDIIGRGNSGESFFLEGTSFLYSAWYIKAPWTGGRQHRSKTWPDCPCALGKDKPFLERYGRTAEAYPILIPFLSYE